MTNPPRPRDWRTPGQRWIDDWWAKERATKIEDEVLPPSAPRPPKGETPREAVDRMTESMIARRALPLVSDDTEEPDDEATPAPPARRGLPLGAEEAASSPPPAPPAAPKERVAEPVRQQVSAPSLPKSPVTPKSRPTPPPPAPLIRPAAATPPPAPTTRPASTPPRISPPAPKASVPPPAPAPVPVSAAAIANAPAATGVKDPGLKPTRNRQRKTETFVPAEVIARGRRRRRWGFGLIAILVLVLAAGAGYLLSRPTSGLVSTKPLMLPATLAEYTRDPNSGTSPSTHPGTDQKTTISATYSRAGTSMFIVVASRPETDAVQALEQAGASQVRPVSGGACGTTVDQDRQACMVVRGGTAVMVLALQGQEASELLRVAGIAADTVS